MRHIISVLMENEAGSLSRLSGLFSARGYNIESLSVAPTNDETLSRLTLVTSGDDRTIDQIRKQLERLIDVYKVADLTINPHIEREMILIKVQMDNASAQESEILREVAQSFKAEIIEECDDCYIIEAIGPTGDMDRLLKALENYTVLEIARSGAIGLARGRNALESN